ncbi:Cof-type HAD-IIB family hydrolase [Flavobacterium sp. W1B]|uniref:Cof-type HAD-IIB family hydrolase n=1 Tax=Flavobacterium sp. W1B TaxID=3394146 RepID=UPI0039BCDB56
MINEKIKVIISDLDGTLLNSNHTISEYTKTIFQELHNQNYLIIVATGRHHLDAMSIVETLGCPVYLVTSNGARIHSPENELLFSVDIDGELVKAIFDLEIDSEITSVLFKEHIWQTNKNNDKLNSFNKDSKYLPEIVDFDSLEDFSAIKIFFTHDNHQKLVDLKEQILEKHPANFNHAFSLPFCLEFMDKDVDKSVAIAKILEKECFNFEQAMSFGDGFNDENMLKSTGKALIMGNASQSLMDKLPHLETILSNENDGVAKYLAEKVLNGKVPTTI